MLYSSENKTIFDMQMMSYKSVQHTECIGLETTLCYIGISRMLLNPMQMIRYVNISEVVHKCVTHRTYCSRMHWFENMMLHGNLQNSAVTV